MKLINSNRSIILALVSGSTSIVPDLDKLFSSIPHSIITLTTSIPPLFELNHRFNPSLDPSACLKEFLCFTPSLTKYLIFLLLVIVSIAVRISMHKQVNFQTLGLNECMPCLGEIVVNYMFTFYLMDTLVCKGMGSFTIVLYSCCFGQSHMVQNSCKFLSVLMTSGQFSHHINVHHKGSFLHVGILHPAGSQLYQMTAELLDQKAHLVPHVLQCSIVPLLSSPPQWM